MSKTVPISQSGSYYRRRARVNRDQGRAYDAYKLILKALEQSPQDAGLLLDRAVLLSEMGLSEKSSADITSAMELGAPRDKLMYALYKNLLSRQLYDEADAILDAQRSSSPYTGKMRDERNARAETGFLPTRRERRGMKLLLRDVPPGSETLRELSRKSAYLSAMRSIALIGERKTDEARKAALASRALLGKSREAEPVCACAQALALSGLAEEAEDVLGRLDARSVPVSMRDNYIRALSFTGAHDKIYAYCACVASSGEFDPVILHALSISAIALGMDREKALFGFRRILECDEDNIVAGEFIAAYGKGQLRGEPDEYRCALTAQMLLDLNERLSAQAMHPETIDAAFSERLCYFRGDERLQEVGVWLTALKRGGDARQLLSLLSLRPDIGEKARASAAAFSGGAAWCELSQRYAYIGHCRENYCQKAIKCGPVWIRRIYEDVCFLLDKRGQGSRRKLAAEILWRAVQKPELRRYMFCRMNASCAALWYLSQKPAGDDETRRTLAQLEYKLHPACFRNMTARLEAVRKEIGHV